jgi:hypothetical protein
LLPKPIRFIRHNFAVSNCAYIRSVNCYHFPLIFLHFPPAARITKDGISLRQLTVMGRQPDGGVLGIPRENARSFTLGVAAPKETEKKKEPKGPAGPGTVKTAEMYNRPFPVNLDDWVFKLKVGDSVRLEGKITQAKRIAASSTSGRGLGIIVGEFKLSPGDKK